MPVRQQDSVLDGLMRFQNLRDAVQGIVREDFQDARDVVAVDQRVARVSRARTDKLAHEVSQCLRASVSSHRVDVGDGYNPGQGGRKSGRKPRVSLLRRVAQRLQSPRQRLVVAEPFKEFYYLVVIVDGIARVPRHQRVEGSRCQVNRPFDFVNPRVQREVGYGQVPAFLSRCGPLPVLHTPHIRRKRVANQCPPARLGQRIGGLHGGFTRKQPFRWPLNIRCVKPAIHRQVVPRVNMPLDVNVAAYVNVSPHGHVALNTAQRYRSHIYLLYKNPAARMAIPNS